MKLMVFYICNRQGIPNTGVYVDDIIIYNDTWLEHINTIEIMLEKLKEANLPLKPSKCYFGQYEIEFIGHVIRQGKIQPNKENTEKIMKANRPTTKKCIQSFLGVTGYYRNFIPNYSAIAAPLTDLIKKGLPNEVK